MDRFGQAAADDANLEGEYLFLDALAQAVSDDESPASDAYREAILALGGDERDRMWDHAAAIFKLLRKKGILDMAPVPEADSSDWLSQ